MLSVNFSPFPTLTTDRLTLRQLTSQDDNDFFRLRSNPEIMRFIPRPLARSVDDVSRLRQQINDAIRKNEAITWAITRSTDLTLLGTIGFVRMNKEHYRAEVGYLLSTDHQGQGVMREALRAVITYGFHQLKLHSIEGVIDPENTASARVLEQAGFRKEAHFRENQFIHGQFRDSVHYSLLTPVADLPV